MAKTNSCDQCNRPATKEIDRGYRKQPLRFCNYHYRKHLKYLERNGEA